MTIYLVTIFLTIAACAADPRPAPRITIITDDTASDALSAILPRSAQAWAAIDIGVSDPIDNENLPTCQSAWFSEPSGLPCDVTIFVSFTSNALLNDQGGRTNHVDRTSAIANDLPPDLTQSVLSREIGFSLFDTADTLAQGEIGVMSATLDGELVLTSADRAFASTHSNGWAK